jgi:hypothetical protein
VMTYFSVVLGCSVFYAMNDPWTVSSFLVVIKSVAENVARI